MRFKLPTSRIVLSGIGLAVVASAVLVTARNPPQNRPFDLAGFSWRVGGAELNALNGLSSLAVRDFVFQVIQSGGDSQSRDYYTAEGRSHFLIGDFKFVDLNHD